MCRETERFEQMMERLLDRELQEYEEELFEEEEDDDDAMTKYDRWYEEQKDKEVVEKYNGK